MTFREKPAKRERPSVDEWGMYDPERSGLAAVRARIDAQRRAAAPRQTFGIARLIVDSDAPTKPAARRRKA